MARRWQQGLQGSLCEESSGAASCWTQPVPASSSQFLSVPQRPHHRTHPSISSAQLVAPLGECILERAENTAMEQVIPCSSWTDHGGAALLTAAHKGRHAGAGGCALKELQSVASPHWSREKCEKEEAEEVNSYVPPIPCLHCSGWDGGASREGVKLGLGAGEERCCSNVCLFCFSLPKSIFNGNKLILPKLSLFCLRQ